MGEKTEMQQQLQMEMAEVTKKNEELSKELEKAKSEVQKNTNSDSASEYANSETQKRGQPSSSYDWDVGSEADKVLGRRDEAEEPANNKQERKPRENNPPKPWKQEGIQHWVPFDTGTAKKESGRQNLGRAKKVDPAKYWGV